MLLVTFLCSVFYVFGVTSYIQNYDITTVSPPGLILKSPRWSVEENALYWVDVFGQKIHRLNPETGEITTRNVEHGSVNILVPVKSTPGYIVVGVMTGLYLLKWGAPGGDSALRLLTVVDLGKPDNMIDDGGADANGRLWFGTTVRPTSDNVLPSNDTGTLFVISANDYENPKVKLRPVSLSNSVVFSKDNKKMYLSDTFVQKVYAFDFDLQKGNIANQTILYDFEKVDDISDGMTIDSEGNLWVASFHRAKLMVIDGDTGKLLDELKLPVDQVTSATWGGTDFKTLYVTTGRYNVKSPMPLSGALFAIRNTGRKGMPGNTFVFPDAVGY